MSVPWSCNNQDLLVKQAHYLEHIISELKSEFPKQVQEYDHKVAQSIIIDSLYK